MEITATDRQESLPGYKLLKSFETSVTILLVALAVFHVMVSAFQYVILWKPLRVYEYMAAGILAFAVVLYLLISLLFYSWNLERIRAFLRRMTSWEQIFLLVFTGWFGVSCLINKSLPRPGYTNMNTWYAFDVLINAAVLFPLAKILCSKRAQKVIEWIILLILAAYSAFTIYGLWHLFHRNTVKVPYGSSIFMNKDPYALRLACHYNITGIMALLMLAICLYFITGLKKKWSILFLPLVLIHLFTAHLSNSRTVFLTGLIIIPIFLFFHVIREGEGRCSKKRFAAAFLFAGSVFAFYWFSRPLSFDLFEKVSHYKELVYKVDEVSVSASQSVRPINNISGRENIWKASLKALWHDPLTFFFGVSPTCITKALMELGGCNFEASHAHNMVLQVGMSAGVPPMIAYCVFLFGLCVKCVHLLFDRIRTNMKSVYRIPFFILFLVVPCLVEHYIASYHVMCGVFTLFAGWVFALTSKEPDLNCEKDESAPAPKACALGNMDGNG